MINNLTIRSGININSDEYKEYLEFLKEEKINASYLDWATSINSPVLTEPLVFDESSYDEYKIDDISFIIENGNVIGHMVYSLEKKKTTIHLSMGSSNHLDMERIKQMSSRITFNRTEYFCKYNIDINNIIFEYLSSRIHGKLEYKGTISLENKIRIKK